MDSNIMITNPGPLAGRERKPKDAKPKDAKFIDGKFHGKLNRGMREYNKSMWFRSEEGMKALFDQRTKSISNLQKIETMKYELGHLRRGNFGAVRYSSLDGIDVSELGGDKDNGGGGFSARQGSNPLPRNYLVKERISGFKDLN